MRGFGQDFRYGVRTLFKNPGFTAVAVVTLAIGIGANTAIFSAVNAMLIRPLPVEDGDQIVGVFRSNAERTNAGELSYPDYVEIRDDGEALAGVVGHKLTHVGLGSGTAGETELVWGELVTGNFFDVLGVTPVVGRAFLPEEDRTPGSHPVAVISYGLWQRRFAADPGVAGKVVKINGRDYTVVGVAPESFKGTKFALALDIWIPIMMHDQIQTSFADDNRVFENRGSRWLEVLGRLKPGVSLEQARARLDALGARLAADHPDTNAGQTIVAFPERDTRFGEDSQRETKLAAGFLMLVVAMVLLIACANVSNLLLARASERHKEIGVRLALGAGRWRVVRQLLVESVMLALLGGAAGVLLAVWGVGLLRVFIPPMAYPIALDASPDASVLAVSVAVMLAASLVFGLAPALHASRLDVVSILKGGSTRGGTGRNRLRSALVVSQLALSFVLLVGAGLCLKSLANAQAADPGFEARNVLFLSVDLGLLGYEESRQPAFYRQLVERVEALPGVRAANAVDIVPLGDSHNSRGPIVAEGTANGRPEDEFGAGVSIVDPGHFETLGIPVLRGRDFTDADTADSRPVVVVNETLAEKLWPGQDAVGKRFRIGRNADAPLREVVGVVKTGKYWSLGETPRRYMYVPLAQSPVPAMTLLVRTEGDPLALAAAVRDEVRRLDPNLPIYDVKSLDTHLGFALWGPRMGASLSALFGVVALVLAIVGLYGVMSYIVSQQTREIGIRMALGALPKDVLRLVVARGMWLTAAGVAIGLLGALALTQGLASLLFGVSPMDPAVFAGICALLVAVAFVATYVPARRATRVDPMSALRYE